MDWLADLTNHIVNAVTARLAPKFDGLIAKVEAAGAKVESLRSDVSRLSTKVDALTGKVDAIREKLDHLGGGFDPAQLTTLTDLTARLRVSATTLKATVAFNSPTPK